MDYGRALRIIRAARNLTQIEVAKLVGCNPSAVSRYESGDRVPSLDQAQRLAKGMQVPFDLFLVLAEEQETFVPAVVTNRLLGALRRHQVELVPEAAL